MGTGAFEAFWGAITIGLAMAVDLAAVTLGDFIARGVLLPIDTEVQEWTNFGNVLEVYGVWKLDLVVGTKFLVCGPEFLNRDYL